MKKLILLLLLPIFCFGQVSNGTETEFEALKVTNPQTVPISEFITTTGADGTQGKILGENISINPPTPLNYIPTNNDIKGHLGGIDNKLGTIVATTAGVTTRIWFTADVTVVSSTNYYATGATKGTASSAIQTVSNDDNQKKYYLQDVIGAPFATATIFPVGVYAGNLSASTTPNSAQQRWTVEIYKCNNAGTPIASGITGAPVGDLGVTVITILDSGLLTLADGSVTNVQVSGNLASPLSVAVGERIRYHVSAEKVGTVGNFIAQSVYFGTSYNSFLDVPVPLNTTAVQNLSSVSGATTTDALNTLNAGKANDSNVVHLIGDEIIDGNKTFTKTIISNEGVKTDIPVLNSSFTSTNLSIDFNQGYTFDGTNHYLIGTSKISKRDSSWNVIVENTSSLTGISGVNHSGDGVYLSGFLYIPVETYPAVTGMKIAKYDATTLALVTTYDISAQAHECSSLTTDGTTLYVSSFLDGSKIWKYNLTGSFLGVINISTPFTDNIQGISYYAGDFYVSEQTKLSRLSLSGTTNTFLGYLPGSPDYDHRGEGLDVVSGVPRVSIINSGVINIWYLSTTTTDVNVFQSSSNGDVSFSGDLIRRANTSNTDYIGIGTGETVLGSRGTGVVPLIATRTSSTTNTGMFQLAIQNSDIARTSEADILFRTAFETGTDVLQTLTTGGNAFQFLNGNTSLLSIARNGASTFSGSITSTGATARGLHVSHTITASANNNILVGLDISPTFANAGFTGVTQYGARMIGSLTESNYYAKNNTSTLFSRFTAETDSGSKFMDVGIVNSAVSGQASYGLPGEAFLRSSGAGNGVHLSVASVNPIRFSTNNGVEKVRIYGSGNVAIQNGGTFTDDGVNRLQVTGSGVFTSTVSGANATLSTHFITKSQSDLKADLASPSLTGIPTAPTATAGTNTTQIATTAFVQTAVGTQPLKYVALLSQTGTGAPLATVLTNTLGGTVVWARTSAGFYTATLTGAFTVNKTHATISTASVAWLNMITPADVNSLLVQTAGASTNALTDDMLLNTAVKIEVYP